MEENKPKQHSHKIAVNIYVALLKSFGAAMIKRKKVQYATNIYGYLHGIQFVFRVHYNKNCEFTRIDWQQTTESDLEAVKLFFDRVRNCINKIEPSTYDMFLPHELEVDITNLSINDCN